MKGGNNKEIDGGGRRPSQSWSTTYGAARGPGDKSICSIIFANINTFPNEGTDPHKKDSIKDMLKASNAFAFCEHNQNTIPYSQINNILPTSYGRCAAKYAHLKHSKMDSSSPGGAGVILDGILSKFIHSSGNDRLGRWSWYTLRGRSHRLVTIISTYRASPGWVTYANQLYHLRKEQLQTNEPTFSDPSEVWNTDMDTLLHEKCIQGPVIIGGDFNSNLNDRNNSIVKLMEKHGMQDVFSKYDNLPSHTHARGSERIDSIFTSFEMTRAGYSTLSDAPSDHRWMFLEISFASLLGFPTISFPRLPRRRVTCKIPKVAKLYNEYLQQQLHNHKIDEKSEDLQNMLHVDAHIQRKSKDVQILLDQITEQTYQSIRYADQKCRKIREGDIPFSPKMQSLRTMIRFLKLLYRKVDPAFRSPRTSRIRRLASIVNYKGSLDIQPKEARALIHQAKKDYKALKPKFYELRKDFLVSLASDKAQIDGKDTKCHLKQLIYQERQKNSFRNIKRAVGKIRGGQVLQIEKQLENGTRLLLTDRNDVENEIMRVTAVKLMAANPTILRQFPYSSYLGESGDFSTWEKLIDGRLTLPEAFDSDVRAWMTYLQSTMPSLTETMSWTPRAYSDSWRLMREETGCGPGPDFACLKSIAPGSIANTATSLIALTPMQTGLYPSLWNTAIEQLIPKKIHDLRATKLRRITLFTAQLNHNKKFLGKRMMAFGEQRGLLAKEQYGSRKSKSSIQHAWNKRMVVDWMLATHTPGVYIANDASGCYDRILLLVAYLTLRRQGIPEPAAFFSISCLLNIKYHVRTAWGTSKSNYGGSQWQEQHGHSPHGIGQGSGDGPGLWAGISSPLFELMRSRGHGFEILTSLSQTSLHMVGFGFVDDTDLLHTLRKDDHISTLIPSAQTVLNDWNKLLRITGGALEPSKSHFVYIEQEWKQGEWRFKNPTNIDLTVSCPLGRIQPLERISPSDAKKTLGLFQAIDGDENAQYDYLWQQISIWSQRLYAAHINHRDARLAASITINATLSYPLAATCLSQIQCNKLSSKLITVVLPRIGIVRTASHDLAFGPKSLGGLGLLDIRLIQLISHLNILIKFGGTSTPEGILITTMVESYQLELGMKQSIFTIDPMDFPWITESWLWFTLRESRAYEFHIHANHKKLSLWREDDTFLMDAFTSLQLSTSEWRSLNRTRMYLHLCTISDIADDRGSRLRSCVFSAHRPYSLSSRAYEWPNLKVPPTPSEIQLWRRCIKTAILTPHSTLLNPRLRVGRWYQSSSHHATWWQDTNRIVYSVQPTATSQWGCIQNRRTTRASTSHYSLEGTTTLPSHVVPTMPTIHDDGTISTILAYTSMCPNDAPPTPTHWALANTFGAEEQQQILAASIYEGTCKMMCDGSMKYRACSSCFVSVLNHSLGGTNIVPGHTLDNSAHRSEIGGLLGTIMYINSICKTWSITSGSVTSGCDCLNVVRKVRQIHSLNLDLHHSCYDLFRDILHHLRLSPVKWTFIHVRGHQDKKKPFNHLSIWEQANVIADTRAKAALEEWILDGRPTVIPSRHSWGISIRDGPTLASKVSNHLIHFVRGVPLKHFWIHMLRTEDITPNMIHWEVFAKSMQYASDPTRLFRTKHMAHITPTGVNLKRRGHREDALCPYCGEIEDNIHIFACAHEEVCTLCTAIKLKLSRHLQTCSCPPLASFLLDLFFWPRTTLPPTTPHQPLQLAAGQQRRLGPNAGAWGFFAPQLITFLQHQWDHTRHHKRSPTVWFAKLAHLQWTYIKDLWIARNQTLHHTSNKVSEAESVRVNQDILNLLQDIQHVPLRLLPPADRHFFKRPYDHIISRPLKLRRRWLRQASTVYSCWLLHRQDPAARPLLDYILRETDVT